MAKRREHWRVEIAKTRRDKALEEYRSISRRKIDRERKAKAKAKLERARESVKRQRVKQRQIRETRKEIRKVSQETRKGLHQAQNIVNTLNGNLTLKELQKEIKLVNERVATMRRKYGEDSHIYQSLIKGMEFELKGSPLYQLIKTTQNVTTLWSGHWALHQSFEVLKKLNLGDDTIKEKIEKLKEVAPTMTEHKAQVMSEIEYEKQNSDFMEDVENIFESTNDEVQMLAYENAKEAVKTWIDNNKYGVSPVVEIAGGWQDGRPPTYWDLYKAIAKYTGNDFFRFSDTTSELRKPTRAQITSKDKASLHAMADKARKQLKESNDYDEPDITSPGKPKGGVVPPRRR